MGARILGASVGDENQLSSKTQILSNSTILPDALQSHGNTYFPVFFAVQINALTLDTVSLSTPPKL